MILYTNHIQTREIRIELLYKEKRFVSVMYYYYYYYYYYYIQRTVCHRHHKNIGHQEH